MLVRYFMSQEVFALSPDTSCEEALKQLRERRIRRVPIMSGGRLIGMVSERDLLRFLPGTIGLAGTDAGEASLTAPVRRVMSGEVFSVRATDHLETAARLMLSRKVGGLPVVEGKKLIGIITESDIFRALWSVLSSGAGSRIVMEEEPSGENGALTDFVSLCSRNGCHIHSLLRHPLENGSVSSYLRVEGGGIDQLIEELWKEGDKVLVAERLS